MVYCTYSPLVETPNRYLPSGLISKSTKPQRDSEKSGHSVRGRDFLETPCHFIMTKAPVPIYRDEAKKISCGRYWAGTKVASHFFLAFSEDFT